MNNDFAYSWRRPYNCWYSWHCSAGVASGGSLPHRFSICSRCINWVKCWPTEIIGLVAWILKLTLVQNKYLLLLSFLICIWNNKKKICGFSLTFGQDKDVVNGLWEYNISYTIFFGSRVVGFEYLLNIHNACICEIEIIETKMKSFGFRVVGFKYLPNIQNLCICEIEVIDTEMKSFQLFIRVRSKQLEPLYYLFGSKLPKRKFFPGKKGKDKKP